MIGLTGNQKLTCLCCHTCLFIGIYNRPIILYIDDNNTASASVITHCYPLTYSTLVLPRNTSLCTSPVTYLCGYGNLLAGHPLSTSVTNYSWHSHVQHDVEQNSSVQTGFDQNIIVQYNIMVNLLYYHQQAYVLFYFSLLKHVQRHKAFLVYSI